MIRAGFTGIIYRSGCRNGAHRYEHALATADTSAGAAPCTLREFLGAGLVPRPVKLNEAQCVTCIVYHYYYILFF